MTHPPARAVLAVAAASTWESLVAGWSGDVHPADLVRPDDFGAPVKVSELRVRMNGLQRRPLNGRGLHVVPHADGLNAASANLLLKSLEEPADGWSTVLLAETEHVLPTVRSRVRTVRLATPTPAGMKNLRKRLYLLPLARTAASRELLEEAYPG